VVRQTDRLVAVPSVGSLVPGWLLVMPKVHALSLAEFGRSDMAGLEKEIGEIAATWSEIFGPLTWFEHGPCAPGSTVGCSVDHAHMHLVPLAGFDLLNATKTWMPEIEFERVDGLAAAVAAIDSDIPYLHLRTEDRKIWLARSHGIPSQAFRRVIATAQGRPEEFDWKNSPHPEALEETIRRALALVHA
jgi:ATP adenylyltransferase